MAQVRAFGVDHLAVTGDLTNLSLPDEFERARDWLAAQGTGDAVTVVPGNHDALVAVPTPVGLGLWADWMGQGTDFPFVRRLGCAVLVGLSSAVPTAPFLASGRIGPAQLQRLEAALLALEGEGLFRIVLVHHPVTDGAVAGRKALADRAALRAVLARAGAELVLHGHSHRAVVAAVPGPRGGIPVVSAPSASGAPAGWNLIEVEAADAAWRLTVSLRGLDGGETVQVAADVERPRPPSAPHGEA